MGLAPHRACTCSRGVEHGSTPCEQVLRGCGALLHIVRARAPRVWSIAPRRASTCSEGLEHCSASCEHCSEGVERCSTSCEHALRGSGTLLHVVRARLQLDRSAEPPGGLIRTFDTKP